MNGCDRKHYSKNFCGAHYTRFKRTGAPHSETPLKQRGSVNLCSVAKCEFPMSCKELCEAHYERLRRTGKINADVPVARKSKIVCAVVGCGRAGKRSGLCEPHNARKTKYGDVLSEIPVGRMYKGNKTPNSLKDKRLRQKYNITEEDFNTLKIEQGGQCVICQQKNKRRDLVVDHNHISGKVRGLLCDRCNKTLGLLQDKPELATALASYLIKHGE